MSASANLRALDGRLRADRYNTISQLREKYGDVWPAESSKAENTLRNALPLIADCIEAAEGIEGELPIDQGCHDMLYCVQFRAALTALREHLEGGD